MNICMIPVRQGSVRLPKKNYLKLNDKAIYQIAIEKALKVNLFDKIVLNTDDPNLEQEAFRLGVDFYLRDSNIASSEATSEMVVLDFFQKYDCERVFWLNTVSPLQTLSDIKNFFHQTLKENCLSSVAVTRHQVHATFKSHPINFNWKENFAKTQDMKPVTCFNYSMMSWHNTEKEFLKKGQLFNNSTKMIESSIWSNFLLKSHDDFLLIQKLSSVSPY